MPIVLRRRIVRLETHGDGRVWWWLPFILQYFFGCATFTSAFASRLQAVQLPSSFQVVFVGKLANVRNKAQIG